MTKLTQILRENQTWNLSPILVFVDNFHHPFFETQNKYVLPSLHIHGLDEFTAERYLHEIKAFLPEEIKNFSVLPLKMFKRESSKLMLGLDLNFNQKKFIYIIKFECKHLGGIKKEEIIQNPTQEYGVSCLTNKIYFTQGIFPILSIQKEKDQILSFELLPFQKSIFEAKLESPKKKFISELFDEIDFSHLIEEINSKFEFKKHWELGKIFQPLKIENFTLATQFLSWEIKKNIEWFSKFYEVILSILNFETPNPSSRSVFEKWLRAHQAEKTFTKSKNLAWKIDFINFSS